MTSQLERPVVTAVSGASGRNATLVALEGGTIVEILSASGTVATLPQHLLRGRDFFDFVDRTDADLTRRAWRAAARSGVGATPVSLGCALVRAGYPRRCVMLHISALPKGEMLVNLTDITDVAPRQRQPNGDCLFDPITDVTHRVVFLDRLREMWGQTSADHAITIALCELELSAVARDHGPDLADAILAAVAARISGFLPESCAVARYDRQMLAVAFEHDRYDRVVWDIAKRLHDATTTPITTGDRAVGVSGHVGVAISTSADPAPPLRRARQALATARTAGGYWTSARDDISAAIVPQDDDLLEAIAGGQLSMFYQPVLDLWTDQVEGTEALVRWHHPTRGFLTPDSFIPLAEISGGIIDLGAWALRTACRQAATWKPTHPGGALPTVRVNASGVQLDCAELTRHVADALEQSGLAPRRLIIEVTENRLIGDPARARAALEELHLLGTQIALDDFGTGYSSLLHLRQFPVNHIKIDQSFVAGMTTNHDDLAVVESVISLGRELGMTVTAEGVETPRQLAMLRDLRCDQAQGYFLALPTPARGVPAAFANATRTAANHHERA